MPNIAFASARLLAAIALAVLFGGASSSPAAAAGLVEPGLRAGALSPAAIAASCSTQIGRARARIDAANRVDDAITIATLAEYAPVEAGDMAATVKIIPFATSAAALAAACDAVGQAAVSVAPGSGLVIKTRFKELLLSKRLRSMMCGARWTRRILLLDVSPARPMTGCHVWPGRRLGRYDEAGLGDRNLL